MPAQDSPNNYAALLPEGALPLCGFRLLSYITPDGRTCYRFAQFGDVSASQLIGLIEMVKHDITSYAVNPKRDE